MKPAPFDYYAPRTVEEACALLSEAGGGATLLAGGQTLMPLLNLRMSQPFIVVDINCISALQGVEERADEIRVGPMTRQCDIITDPLLMRELPVLVQATRHVGHHQTRNRGTIGGSVALGEPAAELPATTLALGAAVEVRSTRGTRRIPLDELYLGPYMTTLESDELITDIIIPKWPPHHRPLFRELARRPGDFALSGAVGALALNDTQIERASLVWFSMGPTPMRARQAEQALAGKRLDDVDIDAVAELAVTDTAPFDDQHATAEYRRTVGRRLLAKALHEALARKEEAA